MEERLREIGSLFAIGGRFVSAQRYGSGHIHDTFVASYVVAGAETRFIHQRLNTEVFLDPEAVCDNVARVTDHLRTVLLARGVRDIDRRCLRLVPTVAGSSCAWDGAGDAWRTLHFIENATSYDTMRDAEQAHQTARAFAGFAADLVDLPPPPLAVTIPRFHDLAWRAEQLADSETADSHGRLAGAAAESHRSAELLARLGPELRDAGLADLPRRVVHNDCKLNNLLLDSATGEGLCVIDLDTVMEGTIVSDFGELARTGSCNAQEDERDLAAIVFDTELFAGLAAGYVEGAGEFLTAAERSALPLAGPLLALENGLRFLADHLAGDHYFRVHRPSHNLDRARAQLALAGAMLDRLDDARRIVAAV